MKQYSMLIAASVLALLLATGIAVRITMTKNAFDNVVEEALKTSEGYDQRFIDMVNRLEEMLAKRASFGFEGKKDPMTGKVRQVVMPSRAPRSRGSSPASQVEAEAVDPVKLTAIIYDDDAAKFTAVVMDGERSFSVEVGDRVRDRTISKISADAILMVSDTVMYKYDIYGRSASKRK